MGRTLQGAQTWGWNNLQWLRTAHSWWWRRSHEHIERLKTSSSHLWIINISYGWCMLVLPSPKPTSRIPGCHRDAPASVPSRHRRTWESTRGTTPPTAPAGAAPRYSDVQLGWCSSWSSSLASAPSSSLSSVNHHDGCPYSLIIIISSSFITESTLFDWN